MTGGPITNRIVFLNRQIVGNRDRFSMRYQEALICAIEWCPTSYARACTGAIKVDCAVAPESVPVSIGREMSFVRSPAKFSRLRTFYKESINGPGVGELVLLFRFPRNLRIPFGYVYHFDSSLLRQ